MAKHPDRRGGKGGVRAAVPGARQRDTQVQADKRLTTLEAGRKLQHILDSAPGALGGASADPATSSQAAKVMALATGFEVHVPPGEVTDGDIDRRIENLANLLTFTLPRGPGEKLAEGDEVLLDLVGYLGGEVFVAHTDTWYALAPNPLLPTLFESLVGARAPDHRIAYVALPKDYPVAAHAGRMAVFVISVKEARRRKKIEVDDPMFLPMLDRGVKTLDELRVQVRQELIKDCAQQMVDRAKMMLLRGLYGLSQDDVVPEDLVDEELNKRWRRVTGDAMITQGISIEEQKRSQSQFARDPVLRKEARRTVWEERILDAVAADLAIEVSEKDLRAALTALLGPNPEVDGILYRNPSMHRDLIKGLRQRRAVEALLKRAKVFFDADGADDGDNMPIAAHEADDKSVTAVRGLRAKKQPAR